MQSLHVVCPTLEGTERQNPLGYFTDVARAASFWTGSGRTRFKVGLRAMASLPRTN